MNFIRPAKMKKLIYSLIITVVAFIGFTLRSQAQNVYIPDPIFKAALVGDLAINLNADTNIQVSEASAFTGGISLGEFGIYDLTGIEAFVNLTSLDCGTNYLSTIDLSANTALQTLSCSMNQLTNLDVSANINLYALSCGNNLLNSLDLSNNAALQSLACESNSITNLDLSGCPSLLDLYCPNNQLTSLDFSSNPLLTSVGCADNLLTCVDISNNPNVTSVFCNNNLLNSLNLKNGNNTNFTGLNALNNPGLACAQVDNVSYANTNWSGFVDAVVNFSTNCGQPVASFSANDPVCFGTAVSFTDGSSLTTDWLWDFGDGFSSTQQNPNYVYPAGGNYQVILYASSCYGADIASAFIVQGQDIFGSASYTGGPVTNGWALLYPFQPFYIAFDTVQIQPLDASGNFHFTNVADGNYLVQVFPNEVSFPSLTPSYFDNDWAWDSALVINHGCINATNAIDITMTEIIPTAPGIGLLEGLVVEGPGFGRAQGDPVHGVVVKRGITGSSQIVETTVTDLGGQFSFSNVGFGSYTIYVDIPGLLRDSSYEVTVDAANNQFLDLNYLVDSMAVYVLPNIGLEDLMDESAGLKVFPNPVEDQSTIEYILASNAKVDLSISNVFGVQVQSIVNGYQLAGNYNYQFNSNNSLLKSGVYFVTLSIDDKQITQSILVIE